MTDEQKRAYESEFRVKSEPFYHPTGNEVAEFTRAFRKRQAVMLKGPTGCGKSRFVEYMAYKLDLPLVTTPCNEDTDASDLTGRYVLQGQEGKWIDGSLTLPVRFGGIAYLDEVVEARQDTMVLIHSLTDSRRMLRVPKRGEQLVAPDNFGLVISFNPGYQRMNKELKQSTRQRFIGFEFDYASANIETEIIVRESGIGKKDAERLVRLGAEIRGLRSEGLAEGASTRLLIYAAQQMVDGTPPKRACEISLCNPITDKRDLADAIKKFIENHYQ